MRAFVWGLCLVFLGGVLSFVVLDWDDSQPPSDQKKLLEIYGSQISGYTDGVRRWHVDADYVWAGRSKTIFSLESIHNGELFNAKGQKVLTSLFADTLKVNSRNKVMMADGHLTATLLRRDVGPIEPGKRAGPTQVRAGSLRYYASDDLAYLTGDVVISRGDVVIRPRNQVMVNVSSNVVTMRDGAVLDSSEFWVSSNRMTLSVDDHVAVMEAGVVGKRKPLLTKKGTIVRGDSREHVLRQKPTRFSSDKLTYHMLDDHDVGVMLSGNVMIVQPDKRISGREATYFEKSQSFAISGNVQIKASSLNWLLDKKRKSQFTNKEMAEGIAQPVTLNCQSLSFDAKKKIVLAEGGVVVVQPARKSMSRALFYEDHSGRLELLGGVTVLRKQRDTLSSKTVFMNVLKETVRADENVETEFTVE